MSATVTADFTVRDLNRHPAEVLAACDRLGVIRIKSRKGQTYELRLAPAPDPAETPKKAYPDFAARRRAMGMPMMTPEQRDQLDRLIAGE